MHECLQCFQLFTEEIKWMERKKKRLHATPDLIAKQTAKVLTADQLPYKRESNAISQDESFE